MLSSFALRSHASWRVAVTLLAFAFASPLQARTRAGDDFLLPEEAFKATARVVDDRTVELMFDVAPGYYLYREQFRFEASGATLGTAVIPKGQVKFDETFQKDVETYRGNVRVALPVQQAGRSFRLSVTYQGCADKGLCYPPAQWQGTVSLAGFGGDASVRSIAEGGAVTAAAADVSTGAPLAGPERWPVWAGLGLAVGIAAAVFRRRTLKARKGRKSPL